MSPPSPEVRARTIVDIVPTPLPDRFGDVAAFDYRMLPRPFQRWLKDIAERMQCPPDYPAVSAMVALAAIVGRQIAIRPKKNDDWQVIPNLFGGVVGPPGVLKTPSLREPLVPLRELQRDALEAYEQDTITHSADEIVFQEKVKTQRAAIKNSLEKNHPNNAANEMRDLLEDEPKPPVCERFIVNDTTIERLQEILSENPNGVLLFRDELTGLFSQMKKPGHETDRAFLLEAWNGDGSYTCDRIARGMTHIEVACLSIVGGIQPGPIKSYFSNTARGGGDDDGLMQRFQLLVYPDISKLWLNIDREPDRNAREEAHQVFKDLKDLKALMERRGITLDYSDRAAIPYLRFAEEAQFVFDEWRSKTEIRLRSGELPPSLESHLSKYRSLVPSIALLIHLANAEGDSVGIDSLRAALVWAEYLETHARRIYVPVLDAEMESARALLSKLKEGKLGPEFTIKEVYARHWSNLTKSSQARAAVNVLVDYGWLTSSVIGDTGGAPRTTYKLTVPTEAI